MVKNLPANQRCRFNSWVKKVSWRRKWQPASVFLPGKFNGERSLVGYSLWDHKESDTTEQLSTNKTHTRPMTFLRASLKPPRRYHHVKGILVSVGTYLSDKSFATPTGCCHI